MQMRNRQKGIYASNRPATSSRRLFQATAFCLLIEVLTIGCVPDKMPPKGTVIGTDDIGRTVTLPNTAGRIVLMTGSPTDALFAIGAGDRIVAVTDNYGGSYQSTVRRYPSLAALPGVGSRTAPNIEAILALQPDLILVSGSGDNPEKNATALKKAGLTYAIMKSFDGTEAGIAQLRRLGVLCGRNVQADIVAAHIRSEIDAKTDLANRCLIRRPRVYYWWGSGNGTYGRGTALDELVTRAGGVNIAQNAGKDFFDLSPEYIVKSDPDVIIFSYWREPDKVIRTKELRSRPGFDRLKAVRENRIHGIDGHTIHSVMLFPVMIDSLFRWLYPELDE